MRNLCIVIFSMFVLQAGFSQERDFNRFSIELQAGLHVPLILNDNIENKDYSDFRSGTAGVRYMFTECFGLRVNYGYHSFLNKENEDEGLNYHRFTLSGVWNFRLGNSFGFLAHGGLGYGLAAAPNANKNEQTAFFVLGLTPQVKLSERVALFVDGSYLVSAHQQNLFDGSPINSNVEARTAAFGTLSLGVNIYIGKESSHADWSRDRSVE
jgi:OmpA-OmpF porin, OOP family